MSRNHVSSNIMRIGGLVNAAIVFVAVSLIGAGYFYALGDFVSFA